MWIPQQMVESNQWEDSLKITAKPGFRKSDLFQHLLQQQHRSLPCPLPGTDQDAAAGWDSRRRGDPTHLLPQSHGQRPLTAGAHGRAITQLVHRHLSTRHLPQYSQGKSPVSSGFQAVEHGVEQHGVWKDRSSKAVLQQAQRQGPLLALVTCDYCCTKTDHVWGGLHFRHGTQKVAGNAPLASSCTCTDPGIETPSIRCQRSAPHVIQKTEGQFPESSFLTCADDRTETDRICRHFLLKHNFQQSNGTLPLVCLFAGGDGRTGGNHIPGCWSQKWVLWEK